MKRFLFMAVLVIATTFTTNAQVVVANNYESPVTSADGQTVSTGGGSEDEHETFGYVGLQYYNFSDYHDFSNYGISYSLTTPNGFGLDLAFRAQFKSHGNFNTDFLLNYSFCLWNQNANQLLVTLAAGPSMRTQDEVKGVNNKGKLEYEDSKTAFDAVINPSLTVKLSQFVLFGGYFYWAPKFKFDKDKGATGGFNIGVGYSF